MLWNTSLCYSCTLSNYYEGHRNSCRASGSKSMKKIGQNQFRWHSNSKLNEAIKLIIWILFPIIYFSQRNKKKLVKTEVDMKVWQHRWQSRRIFSISSLCSHLLLAKASDVLSSYYLLWLLIVLFFFFNG